MSDFEGIDPAVALLATQTAHVSHLRESMLLIRQELERRAERHDRSKLGPMEFPGFARINATAREHPYGSEEYKAAIAAERPAVVEHYVANSHHPEHFQRVANMGWLDLIEMVCDWQAAGRTYGKSGSLRDSWKVSRDRFLFTTEQEWLIEQVIDFLEEDS